MNTNEEPLDHSSAEEIFRAGEKPSLYEEEIARLSEQNENLKSKIDENKFLYALVVIILFDFFSFQHMPNLGGPIVIGVLQIIFIFVYARMCKVDDITTITETLLAGLDKWRGNNKE